MFTKRNEQELGEIKATTRELERRFQEILEQLERIKENQEQLAAKDQGAAGAKKARRQTSGRGGPGKGRSGARKRRQREPASG